MFTASLRTMLSHKVRLVLTALAIALGVAFMSGTFTFTATLQHDLDSLFRTVNASTDVIVQHTAATGATGGGSGARPTIPAGLLDGIRATPGVAAAEGVVLDQAQLITVDGQLAGAGPGFATTWRADAALASAYPLHAGHAPAVPGEVAIDQSSATTYGYHVGDPVGVVVHGRVTPCRVAGIVGFGNGNGAGRSLVIFPAPAAQELFGKTGRYDQIEVRGTGDVSADRLRDKLAGALPAGVEAVTGAQSAADQSRSVRGDLGFLTNALLAFAAVAVFVAGFVIWNTFSILVAQRTPGTGSATGTRREPPAGLRQRARRGGTARRRRERRRGGPRPARRARSGGTHAYLRPRPAQRPGRRYPSRVPRSRCSPGSP
jgi:putative ABC transport system permease protein